MITLYPLVLLDSESKPQPPALQADSLLLELPGEPLMEGGSSCYEIQVNIFG